MSSPHKSDSPDDMLAQFIERTSVKLTGLPEEKRDAFLVEMHGHIESLVQEHREQGRSDADAIAIALEKMGNPEAIGAGYVAAWIRANSLERFWKTLLTFVSLTTICVIFMCSIHWIFRLPSAWSLKSVDLRSLSIFVGDYFALICMALFVGRQMAKRFPRTGMRAIQTVLGTNSFGLLWLQVNGHLHSLVHTRIYSDEEICLIMVSFFLSLILIISTRQARKSARLARR
jgi:hypothetical protein